MKKYTLKIIVIFFGILLFGPVLKTEADVFSETEQKAVDQQATVDLRFQYFYKTGQEWKDASYDKREAFLKQTRMEEKGRQQIQENWIEQKEKYLEESKKKRESDEKTLKKLALKQQKLKEKKEKAYQKRQQKLQKLKQKRDDRLKKLRSQSRHNK